MAVHAWDREQKNKLATGTLITVDNQIDTATGTIKLKAQFPNPDGLLFPNQFVNVRMVVDTKKDATVIPMAAIQRGAQGTIVYVVKEDKTVSLRPVKMGAVENDNVAIDSGVKPGEMVVTDGIDRLREGATVEVTTPFVPRQRGPGAGKGGDPSKRGERQGKGGAPEAATKADAVPAPATTPTAPPAPATGAPAGAPGNVKAAPAAAPAAKPVPEAAKPAAATEPPPEPPRGGGWRDMSDEKKTELRKKMEGMTDEQKAEFRKKMRERAQQGGQN